ncbi:MAG TPA: glycosyltransferase family 87 protein, partial [Vicinamibacterales bacterium]
MTRVACVAIAAVLLLLAWQGARLAWPRGELRDYGSFIASGRAAAEGLNPYGIYPLTFHVVIGRIDLHNPNLNPPLSVLPLQVLGRLDPVSSFAGWWIFSLACYVVAVALLARRYGAGAGGLLVPWALALAGFWDTLVLGQIYLPLVLCAVCAWLLLDRGRTVAAGLLIGVVVAMKPNFATWPAILLLAGHRRAALSAVASACALSLLPLLAHGAEIYRQWFALIASDG